MNSELFRIALTALALAPIFIILGFIETVMSDSAFFFGLAGIAFFTALGSALIILIKIVLSMWGLM